MKDRFTKRLYFNTLQTQAIYSLLSKIDTVKGQWKLSSNLSPQMIQRLQTSAIITSAGASNRIENIVLSDEEVRELFTKLKVQKFSKRNEPEVAGYLELLSNIIDSYNNISFSLNSILSLHHQLLKYSTNDERHRGKFKFGSNKVVATNSAGVEVGVIFDPTPPHLVESELLELVEWTNNQLSSKEFHPLLLIANFTIEFLAIHPFQDGNGRLSRLITILLLLQQEYLFIPYTSHEKIIEDSKSEYYLALREGQKNRKEQEDISQWVLYFLSVLNIQSEQALKLLEKDNVEIFLSDKQRIVWDYVQTNDNFSKSQVVEGTGLKARTIEEALKKLVDMNVLERVGEGNAVRYRKKR